MKHLKLITFSGFLLLVLSGCHILNTNVMLKTPKDFKYSEFKDSTQSPDYKISKNDIVQFQLFALDGFQLVDLTKNSAGGGAQIINSTSLIEYRVDKDGFVEFPVIGRLSLLGYSVRQAEQLLEEKYTKLYNNPFAIVKVTNKRVILFPGQGGSAKVIPLTNENTNLMEALAFAGGIGDNGKAHRVKLIRGNLQNPEVYLIDLSTIDGLKKANLNLQANDIIYIEPRANISSGILNQLTPIVSILTNIVLVYSILRTTSK